LVAALFAIIRRSALHRGYFATWTVAWYAMVVGIAAVGARYVFFWSAGGPMADAAPTAQALYLVYQAGKAVFWLLACRGALESVRPVHSPRAVWIIAGVVFALTSWAFSPDLNYLLVWQGPLAAACCTAGAIALLRIPAPRRSVGSVATG